MALTKVQTNAIADDAVTTDKLANAINTERTANTAKVSLEDNAVTLAKMAGGTDGQIITYDANGDPIAVGPGTDGQVLTSTGSGSPPAFEDSASAIGGGTGVDFNDGVKTRWGTGNDLELYHVGSGPYSVIRQNDGPLYIQTDDTTNGIQLGTYTDGETMAKFIKNGAVELYHDNAKKLETSADGITMSGWIYIPDSDGTDNMMRFGNGADLQIYHNGSDSYIAEVGTGSLKVLSHDYQLKNAANDETMVRAQENGSVDLYYDNSCKFKTASYGTLQNNGNYRLMDSDASDPGWARIQWGQGQDLQIYHNGTNSHISNSTGQLNIEGGSGGIDLIKGTYASGEWMLRAIADGAVELYHDGTKKLETTSAGGTLTGTWTGAGIDLQCIHASKKTETTQASGGGSTWHDTGITVNITPSSASNTILVLANVSGGLSDVHNYNFYWRIMRDSTAILTGDGSDGATGGYNLYRSDSDQDIAFIGTTSTNFLDSPNTTSQVTYKVQATCFDTNATWYLNRRGHTGANRLTSGITVMEIKA